MSARSQRAERRPEGDDRGGSERDNPAAEQSQSEQGEIVAGSDRSDFHPPRSRTAATSRRVSSDAARSSSHETQPVGRTPTVRWPQRSPQRSPRRYEGDTGSMPDIFSPPRSGKSSSTPRATNAPTSTMEPNQHQSLPRNDNFTVDLESVEFPPDVFNLPMGSFTEDSPPRGNSSDSDERYRRRSSPRASPIARQPPMPLYHDSSQFASTFPPAQSPSPEARRAAAETQYSYYPEPADWYSPPPIEQPGSHYHDGSTPQRSPMRLSSPIRGAEFFQRTPSRPAPFPFDGSPSRDSSYDLINTPKATLGNELSPVDYDESIRLSLPDQPLNKLDFGQGDSGRKPPPAHGAPPPMQSPLSAGFLQDFSTSPMGDIPGLARSPPATSSRRAAGPYGRHPYVPMPPYQPPPPPRSVPPATSLKSSPVVSGERSRKSWSHEAPRQSHPPSSSSSGVRVELGSSGKPLERINEWMRAQTSTPRSHRMPSHHPPYPYHPHYPHHLHHMPPRMPHYPFQGRRTPSKTPTPTPHEASARYPFGSTDKKASASSKPAARPRPGQGKPIESKPLGANLEKENEKQAKAVVPPKRNPCNCKKSRCLKLYCECFSAELFCDGCNCTDCCNNAEHQDMRDKAMKETRSKNPKAFQPRLNVVSDNPAQSNHSMGCRCKKSECLKKYCECFQAGVFCAGKCKCKSCANFAGSQKLIDKRRKMKDVRGAQIAMRAAEEAWKGPSGGRKPPSHPPMPPSSTPISSRMLPAQGMMRSSPDTRSSASQIAPRPHYMGQSFIHRPAKMSFSPLGVVTPGYPSSSHSQRLPSSTAPPSALAPATAQGTKRPVNKITPSVPPRTPAVRLVFDPSTSRKRRKKGNQDEEATFPYFGSGLPEQPKTTALAVFSFLSNEDVYRAALVSKTWKALAEDGELWQFPITNQNK